MNKRPDFGYSWALVDMGISVFADSSSLRQRKMMFLDFRSFDSYLLLDLKVAIQDKLVDPASSHMLSSKIKPCKSKYELVLNETANSSIEQSLCERQ